MEMTYIDRRKVAPGAALLLVAGIAVLVGIAPASSGDPAKRTEGRVKLEDSTMIVEFNDTDDDIGIQPFADGDPWTRLAIFDPNGRKLLDVDPTGKLDRFGLTELFAETHEPELSELPLERFKKRFPAGTYRMRGETVEGQRLVGRAKLSHDIPNGPEIASPTEGQMVPENDAVASWSPGTQPDGVQIDAYQVIVETDEEDPRVFEADLPASVTSLKIPPEFLEPGPYKIEVLAIEESGNQTISELLFTVT
jgi:hypothetical protein